MPKKPPRPGPGQGLATMIRTTDSLLAQRVWDEAQQRTNGDINAVLIWLIRQGLKMTDAEQEFFRQARQLPPEMKAILAAAGEVGQRLPGGAGKDLSTLAEQLERSDGNKKSVADSGDREDREAGEKTNRRNARRRR